MPKLLFKSKFPVKINTAANWAVQAYNLLPVMAEVILYIFEHRHHFKQ